MSKCLQAFKHWLPHLSTFPSQSPQKQGGGQVNIIQQSFRRKKYVSKKNKFVKNNT